MVRALSGLGFRVKGFFPLAWPGSMPTDEVRKVGKTCDCHKGLGGSGLRSFF